jgi:aminopeptidase N
MVNNTEPKVIHLSDYQVPNFLIERTELYFNLRDGCTTVTSTLTVKRNPESADQTSALVLQGEKMQLLSVSVDGVELLEHDYLLDEQSLTLPNVPAVFTLGCVTSIKPEENTSLEGLYRSRSMYCTQCEAEGFRRITYYLDRPDVMSEFVTTIEADRDQFPVLLSNGNPLARGSIDGEEGRHWVKWHDPFKKPAYLFALVAGNLDVVEDSFTTCSGREISLQIFVESKDVDKCAHAMDSLKRSMHWDEEVYGREYDLDIFMIVAVDDFNMGAMENKGLNIFNTSCVLAKPETTTDAGFQRVEGVVAHEYFHNWSGNRVTCRDWFQLSLKEGFTVYRDAEFSSDMGSRTVKRVEDVALLRTHQFAEDDGPMAHPIRPSSFIEISNFYTLTVYEKGAEIVRMIANLLGKDDFRKGSDLYFDRHDGQAVTTEDFVAAMEDASGRNLTQFKHWYSYAGTPRLKITDNWNEEAGEYTLSFTQDCPPTAYGSEKGQIKPPFHIPVAMGLLGDAGDLPLQQAGRDSNPDSSDNTHCVLELTEREQSFVFTNLPERPVPSLLRGLSAPVKYSFDYSRDDLLKIMSRDSDGFCRWDASQQLGVSLVRDAMADSSFTLSADVADAYRQILADDSLDKAMVAYILTLPSEAYLSEISEVVEVEAIHSARALVEAQIAGVLQDGLRAVVDSYDQTQAYQYSANAIAQRTLKNTALRLLTLDNSSANLARCQQQFDIANNMTDQMAALQALINASGVEAESLKAKALAVFYEQWKSEALVVNQWLLAQASCKLPGTLERVKTLMQHEAFDMTNPNKVRSLIGSFCGANAINFHSDQGYEFLADQIIKLNDLNPQIASRLLTPLTKWHKYPKAQQAKMRAQLERIKSVPSLSKDVYEVVFKSLNAT